MVYHHLYPVDEKTPTYHSITHKYSDRNVSGKNIKPKENQEKPWETRTIVKNIPFDELKNLENHIVIYDKLDDDGNSFFSCFFDSFESKAF